VADIATFPTLHDVLITGDNIQSFIAGSAIKAGQVVSMDTDGRVVSSKSDLPVMGVALYDASEGDRISVAVVGCSANLVNADDTQNIPSGVEVKSDDNQVGGTVSQASLTSLNKSTEYIVGISLDEIGGGDKGRVFLIPHVAAGPNIPVAYYQADVIIGS